MTSDSAGSGTRSRLHRCEDALLAGLVCLLLLLACGQILLRNLGITWMWAEPVVRHLVLWTSFQGALVATREDGHIRIDAALRLLPPAVRQGAAAVGESAAAIICLLLTPAAVRFVMDERDYGSELIPGLPRWVAQLVFPLVFGAMAVRFGGRVVRRIRHGIWRGTPHSGAVQESAS